MTRVQIPAYHDMWMRGDRYGEVVKVIKPTKGGPVRQEVAHVLLDQSNKIVRVILADCTVVS